MLYQLALTYTYNTNTTTTTTSTSSFYHLLVVGLIVGLIFWIISIIAFWKVFEKAGRPGWAAIIPIYNEWVLLEIAGKPGWWVLIGLIPYVGGLIFLVLYIIAALELAKRFGKSTAFAIFGLVIFSLIGYFILGFGKAQYKVEASSASDPPLPPVNPKPPAGSETPKPNPPATPPASQPPAANPPQQPLVQ